MGRDGRDAAAVFVADLDGARKARQIVTGDDPGIAYAPAWAPDHNRLALLSDAATPGQMQVFVAAADRPARRLTRLKGALAQPRWSPDGKRIGLLFTDNPPRKIGPTQPAAVETGEIGEKVYYQRLNLVDPESGNVRVVSPPDLYVYEYDWSPDGKQCVLVAAHGSGDNNWYIAQLYVLTLDTGECRSILKPAMQVAVPRWSPDGKSIAFIGGLMSDEGVVGGDIYTVSATGGKAINRTPNLDASAKWLAWNASSRQIIFTETQDGGSGIARLDLTPSPLPLSPAGRGELLPPIPAGERGRGEGAVTHLWHGAEAVMADVARDGRTFARDSPIVRAAAGGVGRASGRLAAADARQPRHSARVGQGGKSALEERRLPRPGLADVSAQLRSARRYPLVVNVHGGPASAAVPRWQDPYSVPAALSRRGYFVFFPNPRGSFGQGERFTRANVKDLGHGDLRDILAGVDEVLRVSAGGHGRIGIGGWSYGGYMTMWAVTQTNRFRAAVAGAGIANWQSYYGQNGIDQWMIPYFGASVYDDPLIYARSSPINFIKRVKTPTLILVGERDVECPLPQSQEFLPRASRR